MDFTYNEAKQIDAKLSACLNIGEAPRWNKNLELTDRELEILSEYVPKIINEEYHSIHSAGARNFLMSGGMKRIRCDYKTSNNAFFIYSNVNTIKTIVVIIFVVYILSIVIKILLPVAALKSLI